MLWHEQSWTALMAMDKEIPVIMPLGSCEQHGRHLPLYVDTLQVSSIAERAEQVLGDNILLGPTLWLGSSDHHMDFCGTLSLKPSLYSELIKNVALSILTAGFRRIFFLNGHGGNAVPAAQALSELVAEDDRADDAYLVLASWWDVARDAIRPELHSLETPFISHACEYETSLMLALRADLVQIQRAENSQPVFESPWVSSEYAGKVTVFRRYHRFTSSGSMGQPLHATLEKGRTMIDAIVAEVVACLKDFATWPELPKIGPK